MSGLMAAGDISHIVHGWSEGDRPLMMEANWSIEVARFLEGDSVLTDQGKELLLKGKGFWE